MADFRLLTRRDKHQVGDEALQEDAVTWVALNDLSFTRGMQHNPAVHLPLRRAVNITLRERSDG
jgi:hypothetical protein